MGSPGNPSNPSNNPDIRIRSSVWCGVVQLDAMGALFILTGIPLCYHSNRPLTCISTGSYWPGPIIACFTQHHGIDCDSINDSRHGSFLCLRMTCDEQPYIWGYFL